MTSELQDYGEVQQTNDDAELHQHQIAPSDYTCTGVSAIPSPSSMSSTVSDERPLQASSDVMPPVSFDDSLKDSPVDQPLTACLQSSTSQAYIDVDINVEADMPAAAAGDAVTSRTRCSCDVGCPCCGRCVVAPSSSWSSWSPLPASSVAALRDVDVFIARYRVSPPPPLIQSPPSLSDDSTTSMLPASTAQFESSASAMSPRITLLDGCEEPSRPAAAELLLDSRSDIDSCGTVHQRRDESTNQAQVAAYAVYSNTSLWNPPSSQGVSHPPAPCVSRVDRWITDVPPSLAERGSLTASDVSNNGIVSLSTNATEPGFPPADCAFRTYPAESDGSVFDPASTDAPRSSVMTLAQQLDAYWTQRGDAAAGCRTAIQHDQAAGVRAVSRPSAPPPAPPGSPMSSTATVDRSAAEYDERLTTQTLPRAASTRSLQAPPPRPPPRSTTQDSGSTSTLLGRSLPPEPLQTTGLSATLDRSCRGQMSTFQGQRTLRDSGGHGGLSGSVQSLPGCDVTAASLAAGSAASHGRAAPQPPRRGSSMSPRLQTKSTRYGGGGRARSTSLRSTDTDVDVDVISSSSSTFVTRATQQLEASVPTQPAGNVAVRETARQATHKPVAQIRPHAIRSPSASSYTRQRMPDDDDSKRRVVAYVDQSSVEARARDDCSDTRSLIVAAASASTGEPSTNTGGWRFGTLRSRIKDYVTAAAGVGAKSRQPTASSSSSSSFADWTMPRGRRPGVARRSSSATSWEPDRGDQASATSWEPDRGDHASSSRGSTSFDDGAAWSTSSYFGVFPGPRPFSSPRSRATEVSLPDNIVASANSSLSTADVTSSITSRISTFLTFLGGASRRPPGSSPTSDTPPPTSSTLQLGPASAAPDNADTERSSANVSDARTPAAKAVVDPIVSSATLERRSCRSASSPPVRSASTSDALAKAAAAAAAAARDARGRQPLRFVREQRSSMSTFRSSGSLSVSVGRSSSFSPQSTFGASEAQPSPPSSDASQISDGRRTSRSGTLDGSTHLPSVAHQSAPSTPLDWHDGGAAQPTMTGSLPVDGCVVRPTPLIDDSSGAGESLAADDVIVDSSGPRTGSSTTVPLSVFRRVDVEVERLIERLQNAGVPSERDDGGCGVAAAADVERARESLLALTRQFVDDSQRLVSGATRSVDALVAGVEPSVVTLTRLAVECRSTAAMLTTPSHGVMLVGRVRDLAQAYRSTVNAARSAVGKPFNSVEMKSLMRQATSLAAILSSLIKMLNRTDIIC